MTRYEILFGSKQGSALGTPSTRNVMLIVLAPMTILKQKYFTSHYLLGGLRRSHSLVNGVFCGNVDARAFLTVKAVNTAKEMLLNNSKLL